MTRSLPALAMIAVCGLAGAAGAAGAKDAAAGRQCFRSHDYQGFRAIDDRSFYVRVNVNDYYRIELTDTCPELRYPDARLITTVRGSDLICGPLDWDLRVGEGGPGGFATPCIVKSQTKLSAAEAAAIPPKQKP